MAHKTSAVVSGPIRRCDGHGRKDWKKFDSLQLRIPSRSMKTANKKRIETSVCSSVEKETHVKIPDVLLAPDPYPCQYYFVCGPHSGISKYMCPVVVELLRFVRNE